MADGCEVCLDHHGPPVCAVKFTDLQTYEETPVLMCRECVSAVFNAMVGQYNDAVAAHNAEVEAICRMLGIELPVAPA
jgi:hypothetical protein